MLCFLGKSLKPYKSTWWLGLPFLLLYSAVLSWWVPEKQMLLDTIVKETVPEGGFPFTSQNEILAEGMVVLFGFFGTRICGMLRACILSLNSWLCSIPQCQKCIGLMKSFNCFNFSTRWGRNFPSCVSIPRNWYTSLDLWDFFIWVNAHAFPGSHLNHALSIT